MEMFNDGEPLDAKSVAIHIATALQRLSDQSSVAGGLPNGLIVKVELQGYVGTITTTENPEGSAPAITIAPTGAHAYQDQEAVWCGLSTHECMWTKQRELVDCEECLRAAAQGRVD